MEYYAHTKDDLTEKHWQTLKDHLTGTAEKSRSFTSKYTNAFYLAGLIHDFGKYQKDFQEYLKKGERKGSVPHASWGSKYAQSLGMDEVSFAVDGHHKGLPDLGTWQSDIKDFTDEKLSIYREVQKKFENEMGTLNNEKIGEKILFTDRKERELFIRYLFSALVDADGLDTEEFVDENKAKKRQSRNLDYEKFIAKLDEHIGKMTKNGDLNMLRNKVREFAVSKANLPPAFYSMNLPTGLGKTLSSVSWALQHAKHNSLKRIIIVLPYISIIDQTAKILKDIFGEEWILEHHSSYNESKDEDNEYDTGIHEISKRLATENWDFPIIVTTTVQFFESLFSNKRSKCRKIHNIAESVVIFDEIQSLSKELVEPTLTMLMNMNKVMMTSFLFCTATQPAFERRENFNGLPEIIPLVENVDELFRKTRRVTYFPVNQFHEMTPIGLLNQVCLQEKSVLCIFNTKKSALNFFKSLGDSETWDKKYHLSTSMCPHHRKQVIEDIRTDLASNRKIIVISTQLIEAGVDFDFPCVFREYAPMESIIQSAGRCNREGKMPDFGKVFIFKLCDSGMPNKQYRSLAQLALDMIMRNPDGLHSYDFFPTYYGKALRLFVDSDKYRINEARIGLNFETVSGCYHLIDKATEGVFISQYNQESKDLYEKIQYKLRNHIPLARDDFRKIQQFSVQVYGHFLMKNTDLYLTESENLIIWHGKYNMDTGISDDPITVEEMIV